MADEVLVERRGRTLIMTINRPDSRNAANLAVSQQLADAVDCLDADPGLAVGIITGSAGNFCSGMDLKGFSDGEIPAIEGRGLGFTERPPKKPMIAAVEGYAVAGGMELVLSTDLVVAAKSAKFGLPEVKRGLIAGGGGLLRLHRRIPYQKAMELILTGDLFSGEQGFALGLVNVLSEDGRALEPAVELAERISRNAPLAITTSKEIAIKCSDWTTAEMWERQREFLEPVLTSNDAQEGSRAFAERREPRWTGT